MSAKKLERILRSADSHRTSTFSIATQSGTPESVRQLSAFTSAAARRLLGELESLSRNPSLPVLLEGETGTGKTLAARAVHDLSTRRLQPFRRVDLAATRREFAASELFGHVSGAFTGAIAERIGDFPLAHRGTLTLDEIGKCELDVQQQLLGAIEYGHFRPMGCERWFVVDVRVVAASNLALEDETHAGRFLPDLLGRLEAGRIVMPTLRDRKADIPPLLSIAVRNACLKLGRATAPRISDELLAKCLAYRWPSNLRELASTMERIVTDAGLAPVLLPSHVSSHLGLGRTLTRRRRSKPSTPEVIRIYEAAKEKVVETASRAGVSRATVYRHLKRHRTASRANGTQAPERTSNDG